METVPHGYQLTIVPSAYDLENLICFIFLSRVVLFHFVSFFRSDSISLGVRRALTCWSRTPASVTFDCIARTSQKYASSSSLWLLLCDLSFASCRKASGTSIRAASRYQISASLRSFGWPNPCSAIRARTTNANSLSLPAAALHHHFSSSYYC